MTNHLPVGPARSEAELDAELRVKPVSLRPCCVNLRHKMMYCDPRQSTPGLVDTNSQTRVYFCIQTCQSLGPDHEPVEPESCTRPGRSCYCGSGMPRESSPPPEPAGDSMA